MIIRYTIKHMKFTYTITKELIGSFVAIANLEDQLKGLPLSPVLRSSLYQSAKIRTSHFSNKIEGNCLTLQQTEEVWKNKTVHAPKRDIHEVKNIFTLFDHLIEQSKKPSQLTTEFICTIHRFVEKNIVRGKLLGHYREAPNAIFDSATNGVIYLPSEATDVPALVEGLVHQLNHVKWEHDLIKAAVAHFGLVTIHPFMDGNGRAARALSSFMLMKDNFQFVRYMAWDEYFFHHRSEYYSILHEAQGDNFYAKNYHWNIQAWLEFFILGIEQSVTQFLEHIHTTPSAARLNRRQEKALRYLKRKGRMTNREYRHLNKVSNFTALADLRSLEEQGFVQRVGQGRSAEYVAK